MARCVGNGRCMLVPKRKPMGDPLRLPPVCATALIVVIAAAAPPVHLVLRASPAQLAFTSSSLVHPPASPVLQVHGTRRLHHRDSVRQPAGPLRADAALLLRAAGGPAQGVAAGQ